MKSFSILVTIILGVASLGLVVWVGQYKASGLLDSASSCAAGSHGARFAVAERRVLVRESGNRGDIV